MLRLIFYSWTPCLLLCMATLLHHGNARVLTEIQAGPLYRVAGSLLSISCNTSGFTNVNSRKEFEFRMTKPANTMVLNIISTENPSFSYSIYRERGNDITLTHVSPNSVLFEIKSLQKDDEGEYDCAVINPEYIYDGIYSVQTIVKVIDDSLSVSSATSTSLSYNQDETLTLTCQASSNTIQHTHLSVAWYLRKEGADDDATLIISLDRDFTLRPGPEFQQRYKAGFIRLDKVGEATYRLTIDRLEPSDSGRIYCEAQEWIEDPDLSWHSLTQKTAEETTLAVKGRETESVTDKVSVVVRLSAQQTSLQEGQELLLTCSVDTENLERFFSVAWLRAGVELARIGPTGILSVNTEYGLREKQGELRASKIGDRDYRLVLQPVNTEDQGGYMCRVWPQERQHGGFVQGEPQDSNSLLVSISASASGLSVEMLNTVNVNEGDTVTLTCKVHGFKDQLSVTWQRKVASMSTLANIIGLSQEGVAETSAVTLSNLVRVTRPAVDIFVLELDEITPDDSGVYHCVVSEWNSHSRTNSQSARTMLTVTPMDSFMGVNLISRNSVATVGDNVELMCRVKGPPRLTTTLSWSVQRNTSTLDNILSVYYDGTISWSGEQQRYHLKVDNKPSERIYYLLINGASHREAGSYQCRVSVFQKNVFKKLPPSNLLTVKVHNPASDLILTPTPALTRNINSDITIKCLVTSSRSGSSRYAVTWILQQQTQNVTILSLDRNSQVTSTVGQNQRISSQQTNGPSFELSIRDSRTSDQGVYVCEVIEWLQDPRGEWYHLPPVSGTVQLTLIEPANDLLLDRKEQQVLVKEGDRVHLKCELISGASSDSCFYKVTWFYTGLGSSAVSLLELDHTGLMRYPERTGLHGLQQRLRLSRPKRSSFDLEIQSIHEGDSGTYRCQVEQFQLGHEGHWEQKASVDGGPIILSVNIAENNLSIMKEELALNVSTSQDFTIHCYITKQSSLESKFQVTWFWQEKRETKRHAVFTSYRNSTLKDFWFKRREQLRFGHALPNQFSLTVLKPTLADRGLYYCEVEEWLPSLSHGWRRAGVERSGYSNVSVYLQEAGSGCPLHIWIGLPMAVVLCSLLVIYVLVLKMRRAKKRDQSLWMEQHQLKRKPRVDDCEGPLQEME
ncbi:immunoglobulin superfamily member 2 [Syngnathus scovelli]|uniref:immunoglobulin superfamily member 2 n=1 Tax=Syngnathus scovelli TaxID=161590 RepID=UPI0021100644|nr:immunoglobulin superfamily member 2 isoform X1 [Syngnathus scovelli]XP_049584943.1 immunoglobulin superfamily member 2 isoform X2 [Syngnathus scovelli]